MELKQMEYYKIVVESGSISEAARILHMSQPPLSMSMKKLEDELGAQLLIRGSRHIQPTEAGSVFYQRVCRILELTSSTVSEVTRAGLSRTFFLGLTPSTIPVASGALADFVEDFPEVHFQIYDGSTFELLNLLKSGVIEAAFLRTPIAVGDYNSIPIKKEPMMAAIPREFVRKNSAIVAGKSVSLDVLAQYPMSLYRRYQQLIIEVFEKAGFSPNFFSICDDTRTSLLWTNNGKAISLIPNSLIPYSKGVTLCPVDCKELETSILFLYKDDIGSGIATDFLPYLDGIIE